MKVYIKRQYVPRYFVKVVLQEVYNLKGGKIELTSTLETPFILTNQIAKERFIKRKNISIDIQDVEDRLLEKMKENEEYSFYVENVYSCVGDLLDLEDDKELDLEILKDYDLEYNSDYISKELLDYIDYDYAGITNV